MHAQGYKLLGALVILAPRDLVSFGQPTGCREIHDIR